ncbi:MAG: hypothetical protein ABJC89_12960 [Acidobacteriota bacterium]
MSFGEHVTLLHGFLDRWRPIVERIDSRLLNARRTDGDVAPMLEACFFGQAELPAGLSLLKGQLAASRFADGFEPIAFERSSRELDPAQLTVRARRHWERHRWPGRNGRLQYAARLYSVFLLRQLEHLCLRIWDQEHERATDRLQDVQVLLDRLNDGTIVSPLVRDARWLIQTAQGPLTRRLDPYFRIAESISASFTNPVRLEIHRAGAVLTSGHLRSQLCHRAAETGRPADDPDVLATTRNSNSMDAALLVRDLVPLLEAYGTSSAADQRRRLADAILQGLSADPELFVTRLDLLAPCTMIEHLFLERGEDERVGYTRLGEGHRDHLDRYARLIGDHAESLRADALGLDPRDRVYSPLGIVYGFCADILSNLALDTLFAGPSTDIGLEDLFDSGERLEAKRRLAEGWKMPIDAEGVRNPIDYSEGWAAQLFDRTMSALRDRAGHQDRPNASTVPNARLFIVADGDESDASGRSLPAGILPANEHCLTSDLQRALETGATAFPRGQIASDRNEGRFLASAESGGKWFGISKVVLTLCTSQGKDALLTGVPPPVVDALHLICPGLVARA